MKMQIPEGAKVVEIKQEDGRIIVLFDHIPFEEKPKIAKAKESLLSNMKRLFKVAKTCQERNELSFPDLVKATTYAMSALECSAKVRELERTENAPFIKGGAAMYGEKDGGEYVVSPSGKTFAFINQINKK